VLSAHAHVQREQTNNENNMRTGLNLEKAVACTAPRVQAMGKESTRLISDLSRVSTRPRPIAKLTLLEIFAKALSHVYTSCYA
jgi:hypothetical protein